MLGDDVSGPHSTTATIGRETISACAHSRDFGSSGPQAGQQIEMAWDIFGRLLDTTSYTLPCMRRATTLMLVVSTKSSTKSTQLTTGQRLFVWMGNQSGRVQCGMQRLVCSSYWGPINPASEVQGERSGSWVIWRRGISFSWWSSPRTRLKNWL